MALLRVSRAMAYTVVARKKEEMTKSRVAANGMDGHVFLFRGSNMPGSNR